MTVPVLKGTTYYIQLAGYGGDTAANILLSWNFVPVNNDNFARAIALTGVAADQTGDIYVGTQTGTANAGATLEVGEPSPGATESNSVWFKWTAPSDGDFYYQTNGSRNLADTRSWDAVIAIYTGAAVNALTTIGGPKDTVLSENMTVPVYSGTTYSIQLTGYENDPALNLLLSWNFVPDGPPEIVSSTPPDGSTTSPDSNLVLTFNKPIAFSTGNITIKDLTTPANDRVMPVDPLDPQISISGRVLTINPTTDLVLGNLYAVQIADSAIIDTASQEFAGILNDTTWNFTAFAKTPTTTTVVSSGTPSIYGNNVTFTATVAPVPSGGTVQFRNNASNLGAPASVNTSTGVATVTTSMLGVVGPNKIYADYSGNYQFEGSTSGSITQGVTKAGLTVTAQNVGRYPNIANLVSFPYQISGFKNGETLGTSGVTGTPALSTTAVLSSPVGTYPITPAVGTLAAANYDFTSFVEGTLTVVDPASPIVINVNIDKVVQPGLVGPAGGLGEVWNTIEPAVYGSSHPNLQTNYAPTSAPPASGPVTTVGLTVPYTTEAGGGGLVWGVDSWGSPILLMLKSGAANFSIDAFNAQRFVITGLNPAKKYDLHVASANCLSSQKSRGVWEIKIANNTTSSPASQACDNTANIIGDNWVLGNNYVLFEDVVPNGSGNITVDGHSTDGYRLPLSGFQLVEVTDPPPPAFRWKGADGGNWTDVANWNNTVPGAADIAILSDSDTAGATATLDADAAVAGLTFNNLVANQVIASPAGKTLTLASATGASLTVEGTHSISANVDITSGTKLGPGSVNLSGTVAVHGAGAGTIAMFVSDGVLGISGPTTLDPGTRMRVDGSGTLEVTGVLNTAGTLFPVGSGGSTATATVILKGSGQWNQTHSGGGDIAIGINGANNGKLIIQDTAQLNSAFMVLGFFGPGAGTVQQNGGTVTLVTTPANYTALARPALRIGVSGPGDYHLNGGTLKCGTIGGSGKLYFNGGRLVANMDDLIIVDPGGALSAAVGQTSFMQGLNQVVVQSGAVIDTAGHIITIAQNLEHDTDGPATDGGLTKQGLGTLKLLGTNTYTGATKVQGGTLTCATAASLAPTALEIDAAAKVNLNYTGTKEVASLTLGGVAKTANGTYGSVQSGATFQDDTYFAGTGMVRVGGSTSFTTWANTNGATGQTPEQDHDNDGVENGIEHFMGLTGSSFTAMPGLDATNKVSWTMDTTYQGTYEVQTSPDLATWTNVDPRPTPSGGTLSYTLPADEPGGKSFVRLLVTPTP
jgi:autotransporter-associated beta strand protein